jgi:hypothetical protein
MTANPVSEEAARPLAHGEGYLIFVGYLQLVAGVLTVLFSVCSIVMILAADAPSLLNPLEAARSYAAPGSEMLKLLAGYMSFQIVAGWLFGLLMILAGFLVFIRRGRRTVAAVAVLNLVNFPHGTTVAIMVLHGLGRPGIAAAFR